jgi:hypothetical protein
VQGSAAHCNRKGMAEQALLQVVFVVGFRRIHERGKVIRRERDVALF